MLEKESEWLLPEKLQQSERCIKESAEKGVLSDHDGDFSAYYAYSKAINFDWIKPHAIADDGFALEYAKDIAVILKKYGLRFGGDILDVGCAIGSITNGLARLNPDGNTSGIDISESAIEVAKKKYPDCSFYAHSADDLSSFSDGSLDLIHAREFYPFTRTNDKEYHLKYLRLFAAKLRAGGVVVLQMVALERGLCNTYQEIINDLDAFGLAFLERKVMAARIFLKMFGREVVYRDLLYPVFRGMTWILSEKIRGKKIGHVYIFVKRRGA